MLLDLAWLASLLARAAPLTLALWSAVALGRGLLVPAQLWLTKTLVDALAARLGDSGGEETPLWLGLLVSALLVERLLGGLQPWLQANVCEEVGARLQGQVMYRASGLDLATFEHQDYYDQLNRAMADADLRSPRLLEQAIEIARTLPVLVGCAVALAALTPALLGIAVVGFAPSLALFVVGGQTNWSLLRQQTRERRLADYYARVLADRSFAKEVRLYRLAGYLVGRWEALFWQTRDEQRRLALRLGLKQRASVLGSTVVVMLGLLWVAAVGIGNATPGEYALLFQALHGLIQAAFGLSLSLRALGEQSGYASDLRAFLRLPREVHVKPVEQGLSEFGGTHPSAPKAGHRGLELPEAQPGSGRSSPKPALLVPFPRPLREGVRFEGVSFSYPGTDQLALAGVSFEIRAGEKVALVGENGAGKTTLVKLLLGLYRPEAGRIAFDGRDLREIDPESLRRAASAVLQQFVRYQLTFRENVGLAEPDSLTDEERLSQAIARAGATDIIARLPLGHETLLGPDIGGVDLSGGEWQRVALARAFFREAELLVLDEPTAALDPLAELALFERFAELARGRTAVLISHRLGMTRLADRVLVLRQGCLVEMGTHEALIQAGGEYAKLFAAQARWYQ